MIEVTWQQRMEMYRTCQCCRLAMNDDKVCCPSAVNAATDDDRVNSGIHREQCYDRHTVHAYCVLCSAHTDVASSVKQQQSRQAAPSAHSMHYSGQRSIPTKTDEFVSCCDIVPQCSDVQPCQRGGCKPWVGAGRWGTLTLGLVMALCLMTPYTQALPAKHSTTNSGQRSQVSGDVSKGH